MYMADYERILESAIAALDRVLSVIAAATIV
jgi:hypothetical protein